MMMQDLFSDVWCYAFSGLLVKTPEGIKRVSRWGISGRITLAALEEHIVEYLPVLYPAEALWKMPFHGRDYIPLQGMASMCYKPGTNVADYTVVDEKAGFYAIRIGKTVFGYDTEAQAFLCIDESKRTVRCIPVKQQYEMFRMMIILKIDFLGLIKEGKAVSVYDFPEDPYLNRHEKE